MALRAGAVGAMEAVRRHGLQPMPARKRFNAMPSVGKSRQARQQPVWRQRVGREFQTIAQQMNAALAGRSWPLTRDEVFTLFQSLRRAGDGDREPLRKFLRRRHAGQPTVTRDEPSE